MLGRSIYTPGVLESVRKRQLAFTLEVNRHTSEALLYMDKLDVLNKEEFKDEEEIKAVEISINEQESLAAEAEVRLRDFEVRYRTHLEAIANQPEPRPAERGQPAPPQVPFGPRAQVDSGPSSPFSSISNSNQAPSFFGNSHIPSSAAISSPLQKRQHLNDRVNILAAKIDRKLVFKTKISWALEWRTTVDSLRYWAMSYKSYDDYDLMLTQAAIQCIQDQMQRDVVISRVGQIQSPTLDKLLGILLDCFPDESNDTSELQRISSMSITSQTEVLSVDLEYRKLWRSRGQTFVDNQHGNDEIGFLIGLRLMPSQVQGRIWTRLQMERERNRRDGQSYRPINYNEIISFAHHVDWRGSEVPSTPQKPKPAIPSSSFPTGAQSSIIKHASGKPAETWWCAYHGNNSSHPSDECKFLEVLKAKSQSLSDFSCTNCNSKGHPPYACSKLPRNIPKGPATRSKPAASEKKGPASGATTPAPSFPGPLSANAVSAILNFPDISEEMLLAELRGLYPESNSKSALTKSNLFVEIEDTSLVPLDPSLAPFDEIPRNLSLERPKCIIEVLCPDKSTTDVSVPLDSHNQLGLVEYSFVEKYRFPVYPSKVSITTVAGTQASLGCTWIAFRLGKMKKPVRYLFEVMEQVSPASDSPFLFSLDLLAHFQMGTTNVPPFKPSDYDRDNRLLTDVEFSYPVSDDPQQDAYERQCIEEGQPVRARLATSPEEDPTIAARREVLTAILLDEIRASNPSPSSHIIHPHALIKYPLKPNRFPPYVRQFPQPPVASEYITKAVSQWREWGYLRDWNTSWNHNLCNIPLMAVEQGPKWRTVLCAGQLNNVLEFLNFPSPDAVEICEWLMQYPVISQLDMKDCFWQFPVAEDCQWYSCFNWPGNSNNHEYLTRLFFGYHNAPGLVQRVTSNIAAPFPNIRSYIDNFFYWIH